MRVESIREFIELSKCMNFTRAAAKANMTQPALSYHIASLEKELGFKLIERGKNSQFTPAGKQFFTGVVPLLSDLDKLIGQCEETASATHGVISIKEPALALSQASTSFVVALAEFRSKNPNIELKRPPTRQMNFFDEMASGYYDCVLCYGFSGQSNILEHLYSGDTQEATLSVEYFPIATLPFLARVKKDGLFGMLSELCPDDLQECGMPYDCRIENEEIAYSFMRNAELCNLKVEMRPQILSVSGEEEIIPADDEILLAEPGYPVVGNNIKNIPIKGNPFMTIFIALYKPDEKEALKKLKEFLIERPLSVLMQKQ